MNEVFEEFDRLYSEQKKNPNNNLIDENDFDDLYDQDLKNLQNELISERKNKNYLDEDDEFEESNSEFELQRKLAK